MANLIEQMNVLKGLTDEHLQSELTAPGGGAPPWLVATEVSRRKDMRQRYDAEKARQKPSTTVVEDLSFGLPAAPASAPGAMPGGIGDAVGAPPVQGFAQGGLVDAVGYAEGGSVGYNDAMNRYNTRLEGLDDDKDRARVLALLAASGAILGGGSSNTLKNVGQGIGAFAGSYGDQLKTIDSEEIQLLRGVTDLEQLQQQFAASEADRGLRREEIGISRERLNTDKTPADILKFREYQKMSDADKAEYERLNPPYNPNVVTSADRLSDDFRIILENAVRNQPEPSVQESMAAKTPEAKAELNARQFRAAQVAAYHQIKTTYGMDAAMRFQQQAGLADSEVGAAGGAPVTVVGGSDPLGLGL